MWLNDNTLGEAGRGKRGDRGVCVCVCGGGGGDVNGRKRSHCSVGTA